MRLIRSGFGGLTLAQAGLWALLAGCGQAAAQPVMLAGTGRVDITPQFESYQDENANGSWDPGESFDDLDQDGELDSLWLGGFGRRQPTGVHDPLEARALAWSLDGQVVVLCAVDSLGLSMGRIKTIQQGVLADADPTLDLAAGRIVVASTHTHAGPDTIGVFGPGSLVPGWDGAYLDQVVDGAVAAIGQALGSLEPVEVRLVRASAGEGYVRDLEPPEILDPQVGIVQLSRPGGDGTVATLISIANHPEASWSANTEISADFPGVLRNGVETEIGGLALYFSGALGLMQSPAELGDPGFGRVEAIGQAYAEVVIAALDEAAPRPPEQLRPRIATAEIELALQNFELEAAILTDTAEGYSDFLGPGGGDCELGCLRLPALVLRLGDAWTLVTIPGEATPELIVGGIRSQDDYGGPYPDAPIEPHLEGCLATPERFVIGLAFAEVGYLYPKRTYWPEEVFSQSHGPGPNVARQYFSGLCDLVEQTATPL